MMTSEVEGLGDLKVSLGCKGVWGLGRFGLEKLGVRASWAFGRSRRMRAQEAVC